MWRRGLQYNVGSSMVCGETIAIIMGTSLSMHADTRGFGDGEGVSESVESILDR